MANKNLLKITGVFLDAALREIFSRSYIITGEPYKVGAISSDSTGDPIAKFVRSNGEQEPHLRPIELPVRVLPELTPEEPA